MLSTAATVVMMESSMTMHDFLYDEVFWVVLESRTCLHLEGIDGIIDSSDGGTESIRGD